MKALSTGGMGDEHASLVVVYKGLNYNNRDNDEVEFLRGIRGAAHAEEVFGPKGVWVYNLLLDFLKFPAGTVSLGELLDSTIERKNVPNDKDRCLAEIGQFWEKLQNDLKNKSSGTVTKSKADIQNDAAVAKVSQE